MSPREVLESYSHIELTEEETDEAILQAKIKKQKVLDETERLKRIEENRKRLVGTSWTFDQMKGYALFRANTLHENKVFSRPFVLDQDNKFVFELMCLYFSSDPKFEELGDFRLNKGICLVGAPGVGKSWLMTLFAKNARQCYYIRDCKKIAAAYEKDGVETLSEYSKPLKAAVNDKDVFYQPQIGIAFSDVGTENVKKSWGNESNVMGDLLFERYAKGLIGPLTHADTNLTADQIEEFYGKRIRSRFREMFNWIELNGKDRRI